MNRIIYILIFFITTNSLAQNYDAFESGNMLYNEGKFQEAIQTYETILSNNIHSAEVYFNLANSYYKLNRVAPSIYYYEKALLLSPNDPDIINNLMFAQNMTIDAIEKLPEVGFSKLIKNTTNTFSTKVWAIISIICSLFTVILFLIYYFSYSTLKKRFSFVGSFFMLFLGITALFFAFKKDIINKNDNPAIVFAQETKVKTEPNMRSEGAFELHEGTKVQVVDKYNENWTKIKLANGKTGWIVTQDIKMLNDI